MHENVRAIDEQRLDGKLNCVCLALGMSSFTEESVQRRGFVKRRKAVTPFDNHSRMTLRTVVKRVHSSMLAPTTIPPEEKQWPSDYPILHSLHKESPLPNTFIT
jgi:hypothetical protein